ncbi:dTDP-4-amino-4,6-dideoxygalactose transaminase [Desulfonispora thiosulfatigenes DSM 11270]|uniref:dTDP-4-amino-4,6-dideoxygalactose transaminase n=1 Tax=Desulfonispora thiosulfatigenes DSM 11270 TaxID=656914 RepID=A0A1W1VK25_DESTI|nr:DegT/DnrJ/EryC1/StrS family aminotransferase [Desulfonispora thiosulfatigenes]SMB93729.1 dTDP-4-amino-4,6-dideoxygalactose transaminase [Desulfonispora thiosulfatigenes DSM 11270]
MTTETKEIIKFEKDFTRQEAIPEAGIKRALEILETGCLHRYNTPKGEVSDVALLEKEYADYVGAKYCAGLSSCGSAIYVALKSVGVKPGDKVLCNAFTLAPVPGAIENAGGIPVFLEIDENFLTNLDDLEKKAVESQAKFLLLSHMRGNIVDMDRVTEICSRLGITLVEDCAHTVGARWGDKYTGTFGKAGCYSTQTYKHMNSGEGGLLVSNDEDVIAKAILYSGSYMLFDRHISRPSVEVFERHKKNIPNFSLRMSNLVAALLRPQLADLDTQLKRWNDRYYVLAKGLEGVNHIRIPKRPEKEHFVASSLQFTLTDINIEMVEKFIAVCAERGVEIKWFGAKEPNGFTSSWESWEYIKEKQKLPQTREVLDFLCDFRIPLTFSLEDCEVITKVIRQVVEEIF